MTMSNYATPVASPWAPVRILASSTLGLDGTRMPSAAPRHGATVCTGSPFEGTFVGSSAWSPPI
jgi:hypothetical protein